jgi:hypothetical protein
LIENGQLVITVENLALLYDVFLTHVKHNRDKTAGLKCYCLMVYSKLMQDIYQGNAFEDGKDTRGWIVGNFLPAWTGLHKTDDVEIKWNHLQAGTKRDGWVTGETRTTLGIVVSGSFTYQFRDKAITLSNQGDYVLWGPGVDHSWEAPSDCILITIRWPSTSGPEVQEEPGNTAPTSAS